MDSAIYPEPPSGPLSVSGATVGGDGVLTATATSVSVSVTVRPLFIDGSAGRLVWSATAAADQPITSAVFRMTSSPARRAVTRGGAPASAVLEIPAGDAAVVLQIVIVCPIGALITVSQRWVQAARVDVGIMLADRTFGDVSPVGVTPPSPSAGLPLREAASAARRSPQVRAAQATGSRRPDLLPRQSSLR